MWSTEHVFSKTQSANETHDVIICAHVYACSYMFRQGKRRIMVQDDRFVLVGLFWEQLQSSERVLSLPERSREESWQRQPGQLIQPW